VVPSLLLVGVAELLVRWQVTGGLVAAIHSFGPATARGEGWLVPDPVLGYRLNPATEGVNRLGIRHGPLAPAPASGTFRLVVLGDSVAFDPDGFVTLLAERLASAEGGAVEVVNASIPGYTTHQERLLFERDLAPLAPDVVLLQYCVNDNHRFLHRLEPGGHWIIVPGATGDATSASWLPAWLEGSYIVKRIRWRQEAAARAEETRDDPFPWRETPEFGNAWREETWTDEAAEISALKRATDAAGARLLVVAVPYEPQLDARALSRDRDYTLLPQRELASIAARLDVPLLDLHAPFLAAASREPPLYRDGLHLTPRGHALAAEALLAFLRETGALEEEGGEAERAHGATSSAQDAYATRGAPQSLQGPSGARYSQPQAGQ
jgi:lysophospholipase L1-like esterase